MGEAGANTRRFIPGGGKPDAATQIAGLIFAVILIDGEARIVEANHAAESLLGKSVKRLCGKHILASAAFSEKRVEERIRENDSAVVARNVGLLVEGAEHRVNLTISPLAGHQGWRVVTISEAGYANISNEDVIAAGGAPSILAHEIKNPLSAIRGAGQLVARKLPHADKKLARMITDEVDRIARLIDRMQQLGSKTKEALGPCNPHEAVRGAIATVRAAGGADVEIVEEFDPSLPPVMANRDVLEQVLINLISNAKDAVDGIENAKISVQTRFVSGLAYSAIRFGRAVKLPIEISVIDNGPGVPAHMRDSIFEPFVSSKRSGQGLGLALVRKLVRDMDGRIGHERDSKKELTIFRIHLPMAMAMKAAK